MRRRADRYAITAALLSTLTGLGVWSTLAASTDWWAVLIVSIVALAAAVAAIVPKAKGYVECAAVAAALAPRYSQVMGELQDAATWLEQAESGAHDRADAAVKKFEGIKSEKDSLKTLPSQLQARINKERVKVG
jgi:hypothetical protein